MNFFKKLFRKENEKVLCPRCLGKGQVNSDDIKRLNMELRWAPGSCAYCNGRGKIIAGAQSTVAVDEAYLTIDLSKKERRKFLKKDSRAIERARLYNEKFDGFIKEIIHLHLVRKPDAHQIAGFYLMPEPDPMRQDESYIKEKKELVDYIKKVIELKV